MKKNKYKDCDMIMALGTIVNFDHIIDTEIILDEIFIHIKNLNRFCGALPIKLYQHLNLTGWLLENIVMKNRPAFYRDLQKTYAYTHDFPEAYLGDVVTGLKSKPYFQHYKIIENELDEHIHNKLGIPLNHRDDKLIKMADKLSLIYEMTLYKHPAAELCYPGFDINEYSDKAFEILNEDYEIVIDKIRESIFYTKGILDGK